MPGTALGEKFFALKLKINMSALVAGADVPLAGLKRELAKWNRL